MTQLEALMKIRNSLLDREGAELHTQEDDVFIEFDKSGILVDFCEKTQRITMYRRLKDYPVEFLTLSFDDHIEIIEDIHNLIVKYEGD